MAPLRLNFSMNTCLFRSSSVWFRLNTYQSLYVHMLWIRIRHVSVFMHNTSEYPQQDIANSVINSV